jgi:hypothetical protein
VNPTAGPQTDNESVKTWESGSELTASVLSAGSSAWTDSSSPTDRTSRRALILQMAKARMKSNKETPPRSPANGTEDMDDHMATPSITERVSEESKEANTDIDFTGDLD